MAYLVKNDLKTHVYGEMVDEITRADDAIITEAIDGAIAEAKSYLNKYDLSKLFDPNAVGFFADANLKNKVKDLAVWQVIALSNPNINYEVWQDRHDKAIRWFEFIMKNQMDPAGWPYKADNTDTTAVEGATINYTSNTKRQTSF